MVEENKKIKDDIILYLIPLIIALIVEIFFKIMNGGLQLFLYINPNSIIFSILIEYLAFGVLISLFKKSSTATTILCVSNFILLIINQIKIIYTGEPIYFSDINFLGQLGDFSNMLSNTIIPAILNNIIYFILLIIAFSLIIFWNKRKNNIIKNEIARISIFCTCILMIILLFIPNKTTKNIYLNLFFNIGKYEDYNSYTTNLSYYQINTLLSGMYGVLLNSRYEEPKNYNEENLDKMLQEAENTENQLGKPNIVIVFSEAFWDIDKIEEVEFNKPITENFNKLKSEGKNVQLLSCSYGGMSENVAFELLTGANTSYFTKGYIPIISLYTNENSKNIPSVVKELKNNKYISKIVFGKDYYNSEKSFLKMGFDEYVELQENDENKKGNYISDEYITDLIIQELKNKKENEKIFYMTETIQNHMEYTKEKYDKYDITIKESELSEDENNTLLAYSQGIFDADKQLGRLYEFIKEYKEPTILIFLGDHLPYLYTKKGENVVDVLKYLNPTDELEKIYRKYNTEALILANYDIDYNDIPSNLSNDLLLTNIINKMDIDVSNYYKWLYSTTKILPAYNKYLGLDIDKNKYSLNKLEGKMKEIYNLREMIQYKFFIKGKK